jgi:hypothetical protein
MSETAQRRSARVNCWALARSPASALAATVPDAKVFKSGRQFSAWLGLTPRQHSSGGSTRLGRISLRGNVYLRTLLIQGARSTPQAAKNREPARASGLQRWIIELYGRRATTRRWSPSPTSMPASVGPCSPRMNATMRRRGNGIPCTNHRLPATHEPNQPPMKGCYAIARRGQTERETSPAILLASTTWHRRSPLPRCAEVQIGFSRAAYIVARAHHRCATRPFAKTQSVPSPTTAPAAIT